MPGIAVLAPIPAPAASLRQGRSAMSYNAPMSALAGKVAEGSSQSEGGATLYATDFYSWTLDQAAALRRRDAGAIDWDNVIEEIESSGRSERSAWTDTVARAIEHMLKIEPWKRASRSDLRHWMGEIETWRSQMADTIQDNPGLQGQYGELLQLAWQRGRNAAIHALVRDGVEREGPARRKFLHLAWKGRLPERCPWRLEEIVAYDTRPWRGGSTRSWASASPRVARGAGSADGAAENPLLMGGSLPRLRSSARLWPLQGACGSRRSAAITECANRLWPPAPRCRGQRHDARKRRMEGVFRGLGRGAAVCRPARSVRLLYGFPANSWTRPGRPDSLRAAVPACDQPAEQNVVACGLMTVGDGRHLWIRFPLVTALARGFGPGMKPVPDLIPVAARRRGFGRVSQQVGQVVLVDVAPRHVARGRIRAPEILVILPRPAVVHDRRGLRVPGWRPQRAKRPAAFRRLDAGDLGRAAIAVGLAVKAHREMDRRGDRGAGGLPREAVRQAPGCELAECRLGRRRAHRKQATVMAAAAQCPQNLPGLGRAHIAEDDAAGRAPERSRHGFAGRFGRVPAAQVDELPERAVQAQLLAVVEDKHRLGGREQACQRLDQGCLAGPGDAGHEDVAPLAYAGAASLKHSSGPCARRERVCRSVGRHSIPP